MIDRNPRLMYIVHIKLTYIDIISPFCRFLLRYHCFAIIVSKMSPPPAQLLSALDVAKTDESKLLGLTVNKTIKVTPGLYIKKAGKFPDPAGITSFTKSLPQDAQSPPEIEFSGTPGTTYMVLALDIDAPFKSWPSLGPILHWIQGGFKSTAGVLTSTDPFVADYIGPAPPPISGPHRYVFLLYEQPATFDWKKYAPAEGAKMGNVKRMWADLSDWEKKMGLGEIIASNYFTSN